MKNMMKDKRQRLKCFYITDLDEAILELCIGF